MCVYMSACKYMSCFSNAAVLLKQFSRLKLFIIEKKMCDKSSYFKLIFKDTYTGTYLRLLTPACT